jgi:ERCC4-type nuclease
MLRIYADVREKQSGVPEILKELGVVVIYEQLTVGDYVISNDVVVERKNVIDLVNSIFDKRFFDQLKRLTSSYREAILLIEGDLQWIRQLTAKWKSVNSSLVSAAVDFDLKILYSTDKRESAEILSSLARKFQDARKESPITLHDKPKFESLADMQLYVVESFPKIGEKTAVKLLSEFNSIRRICNASVTDLEKVIGSRKKAELIFKLFNSPFAKKSDKSFASLLDYFEGEES